MASVTRLDSGGRQGFRVRFYCDKRRREIYIPGTGRKVEALAKTVAGHCDALVLARGHNVAADPVAVAWANGTDGGLRDSLTGWGLADPASPRLSTDEGRLLGPFVESYLKSRTDWKPRTVANAKQVNRLLKEYFGDRKPMKSITPGDAERWRRWLSSDKRLAVSTCSKHAKRAKAMFAEAVRDRLLIASAFDGLKGGDESNSERHRFIDPGMMAKVLEACPDADWRLIITLARYGGLRCPSEVLGLRWTDIDWDAGRLRIESSKTGLRFCPMFPEILLALNDSDCVAKQGAVYCVARYRANDNLRTQFGRIIERAGVKPWPKMFVNLRSSRRTELQERFPDHVINNWLGHSGAVAAKHYLQVTDEHWGRAIDFGTPTGSPIANNQGPLVPITETRKPLENKGFDGLRYAQDGSLIPPQGLEPWTR